MYLKEKDLANFMSKFEVNPNSGCWDWTSTLSVYGYAMFYIDTVQFRAHRISYLQFKGEIPKGLIVRHMCHNRKCVNPEHLKVGTNKENSEDMVNAGRSLKGDKSPSRVHIERMARGDKNGARLHPERLARGLRNGAYTKPEMVRRGENHGTSKLKEVDVLNIRKMWNEGVGAAAMAQQHGVTSALIYMIVKRRIWKHV